MSYIAKRTSVIINDYSIIRCLSKIITVKELLSLEAGFSNGIWGGGNVKCSNKSLSQYISGGFHRDSKCMLAYLRFFWMLKLYNKQTNKTCLTQCFLKIILNADVFKQLLLSQVNIFSVDLL